MKDALRFAADNQGVTVSRETGDRLAKLAQLVQKWTKKINLTSKSDTYNVINRHIQDSLQLWPHRHLTTPTWADLGSGGGFPGIVIAILARELDPDLTVTLVEADTRKSVFLAHAIRELDVVAKVCPQRIEQLDPLCPGTLSARALAPLPRLLDYCARHAAPDTVLLLPKGRGAEAELTEARKSWTFDLTRIPSVTDPEAVLLKIGALQRA